MEPPADATENYLVDPAPSPSTAPPRGNHPLELAARRGFGPLSPLAVQAWHGQSVPCVTCGQLVERGVTVLCEHCGQNLSADMLEKMRAHAGPWYVLEHVRPFPGVNLDRVIRQVQRGLITSTSIVRGPGTDYQWRYAVETPGLCRFFQRCWHCHAQVSTSGTTCGQCGAWLTFERPKGAPDPKPLSELGEPVAAHAAGVAVAVHAAGAYPDAGVFPRGDGRAAQAPRVVLTPQLEQLRTALRQANIDSHSASGIAPPADGMSGSRTTWIAAAVLALAATLLITATQCRARMTVPTRPAVPPPIMTPAPAPTATPLAPPSP